MDQHNFKTHADYVRAQVKLTRRKLLRQDKTRCFTSDKVVAAVKGYWGDTAFKQGLCHGVRKGFELDKFEAAFGGMWIGTEIVPELCDGKRIHNRDFTDPLPAWIGACDIIYTNSLDHARNPSAAVAAWLSCLSSDGCLFVEWTRWHRKLGKGHNRADCYAASVEEYRDLFNVDGQVLDVLEIPDKTTRTNSGFIRSVFVVGVGD